MQLGELLPLKMPAKMKYFHWMQINQKKSQQPQATIRMSYSILYLLNSIIIAFSKYSCQAKIKKKRRKLVSFKIPAKMDHFLADANRLQKIAATPSHDPN